MWKLRIHQSLAKDLTDDWGQRMDTLQIKVSLELSTAQQADLARLIGCDVGKLASVLSPYANAAIAEYVALFLATKNFGRLSDVFEHRLFLLIATAFGGQFPDEEKVDQLFRLPTSRSRKLIRDVWSKYDSLLRAGFNKSISALLGGAKIKSGAGTHDITVNNKMMVDELNRTLAILDGRLPEISRKRGTVATYEIQPSAYQRLCQYYNVR